MKSIDSGEVVNAVLLALGSEINDSLAAVTYDSLPFVVADGIQLAQLFQNLIGNAIRYCGDVTPRIHISTVKRGGMWQFDISDNGVGIAPQDVDRIFEVFTRLNEDKSPDGTGIGLAICKRIAERHGGVIWCTVNPDGGTTFHCTLPASGG
jgi:signal transduction histidine kinase